MKIILIITLALFLTSCKTISNIATIEKTETGVKFETSQAVDMSLKKGDVEYHYSGKSESLFNKIVSIFTLGLVGRR